MSLRTWLLQTLARGRGSALAWVNGKFNLGDHPKGKACDCNHPDIQKIATLDFLVGNTDRHEGNLVRGTDGRFYAMDNGLSLPFTSTPSEFRSVPLNYASRGNRGGLIPKAIKDGVARLTNEKIQKILNKFGHKTISGVIERRDKILSSKTFKELNDEAASWMR
jgi:hypothetical protein